MSASSNSGLQHMSSRALLALLLAGSVVGIATSAANAAVTHTPQSIECSKEADAKGLHGKDREKFRAECKRNAKTSQVMPAPAAATTAPTKAPY